MRSDLFTCAVSKDALLARFKVLSPVIVAAEIVKVSFVMTPVLEGMEK